MNRLFLLMISPALLVLAACEKEDKAYVLPPPGNSQLASVSMGETYETQVYFNLAGQQQYANNLFDWELAFETAPTATLAWMNGGKQVQVYNTRSIDFSQTFSLSGITWQWDSPDGNRDSAALREWNVQPGLSTYHYVYLIDRGPDAGNERYKKMQLTSVDAAQYHFRFAALDGAGEVSLTLDKDTAFNYVYFKFTGGGQVVHVEPGKDNYDLLFTRYRYIYYNLFPVLPYTVNGVLINPWNTSVAVDSITPYEQIDITFAKNMTFSSHLDGIGFDWKNYNFNTSLYEVNKAKCYVIKNRNGLYYKLHFLDFYDQSGIKGTPSFEYQRL